MSESSPRKLEPFLFVILGPLLLSDIDSIIIRIFILSRMISSLIQKKKKKEGYTYTHVEENLCSSKLRETRNGVFNSTARLPSKPGKTRFIKAALYASRTPTCLLNLALLSFPPSPPRSGQRGCCHPSRWNRFLCRKPLLSLLSFRLCLLFSFDLSSRIPLYIVFSQLSLDLLPFSRLSPSSVAQTPLSLLLLLLHHHHYYHYHRPLFSPKTRRYFVSKPEIPQFHVNNACLLSPCFPLRHTTRKKRRSLLFPSFLSAPLSLSFAARQYIWPAWAAHVGLTAKPTETGYTHKRAGRVGKRHTPGRRVHRASSLTPAIFPRRGHVAYQAPHTASVQSFTSHSSLLITPPFVIFLTKYWNYLEYLKRRFSWLEF